MQIMHNTFIADGPARAIIQDLVNEGLLARLPGTNLYHTTKAGKKWLEKVQ